MQDQNAELNRILAERKIKYAKNYEKGYKEIGNVYAVITSKGYAIAQVAGLEEEQIINFCRIFGKLHPEIPSDEHIRRIIMSREDYVVQCTVPHMSRMRQPMAKLIGKYDLPETFKAPEYTRMSLGWKTVGNTKQWIVNIGYKAESMLLYDWVTNVLKKDMFDESWKEDFLKLNPSFISIGKSLVDDLESGWSLQNWRPLDIYSKDSRQLWAEYRNQPGLEVLKRK